MSKRIRTQGEQIFGYYSTFIVYKRQQRLSEMSLIELWSQVVFYKTRIDKKLNNFHLLSIVRIVLLSIS